MNEITPIDGEVWKDIPGFYNYRVSNMGRFMRLHPNGKHRLLHGKIDRVGYQQIGLMDPTHTQRWFLAHRIVACTFSPPTSLQDHENTYYRQRTAESTYAKHTTRQPKAVEHKGL